MDSGIRNIGIIILLVLQIHLYKNWKVIYKRKLSDIEGQIDNIKVLVTLTHSNLITQMGFWMGALFLSLLQYPFYWCLPALSESWKNIYLEYEKSNKQATDTKDNAI